MSITRPPEIERIRQADRQALPEEFKDREEFYELPYESDEEDADDANDYTDEDSGFIIMPGETWLQTGADVPEAEMLFGSFWFQDELCILFADTNAGKSILAVQIGTAISRGQSVGPFAMNGPAETVLYFDFELSTSQFRKRYHNGNTGSPVFNPKFLRGVINQASKKARKFSTYEDYITNEIENALITTKAKVLIIDNLTCLRFGTHAASGALNLVRYLQGIKDTYQLSILVLAHTPKRNQSRPITRDDLLGSKMLINFCDSAFAIGESQLPPAPGSGPLHYLKQIKQRSTHQEYGTANVCLCSIVKEDGFLQFKFDGTAHEAEHLARQHEQYRKISDTCIAELYQRGLSVRQVAEKLSIGPTAVFRALKRIKEFEDLKISRFENEKKCLAHVRDADQHKPEAVKNTPTVPHTNPSQGSVRSGSAAMQPGIKDEEKNAPHAPDAVKAISEVDKNATSLPCEIPSQGRARSEGLLWRRGFTAMQPDKIEPPPVAANDAVRAVAANRPPKRLNIYSKKNIMRVEAHYEMLMAIRKAEQLQNKTSEPSG